MRCLFNFQNRLSNVLILRSLQLKRQPPVQRLDLEFTAQVGAAQRWCDAFDKASAPFDPFIFRRICRSIDCAVEGAVVEVIGRRSSLKGAVDHQGLAE